MHRILLVRTLLLILLSLLALPVSAQPRQSLVPGGIAIIQLKSDEAFGFRFNGKSVLTTRIDGVPSAVVGLPLDLNPGEHFIEKKDTGSNQKKYFEVNHKHYTTQYITIDNKRKVNPYASDMDRILAEKTRQQKALNYFTNNDVDINFLTPVNGINTGSFGRRRVFNGQTRRPHSGMDFAAEEGTPVITPSAGKVIELGDFFFSGKLVYVDHGQGLISMFAHLSDIDVVLGEQLKKGQAVGKVGSTGRVTGPHLHWSLGLNGAWIDPSLFLPNQK
jgi:murein DD-endopeptidase MepM/ murein hydrolase activator NlpD